MCIVCICCHLAIIVKVWIEAYRTMSGSDKIDQHRRVGVLHWEQNIKLEAAISVRCVRRSSDKYLQNNIT